jgi:3-oxoacyl-[acyl-carrier-protein] synthase-3
MRQAIILSTGSYVPEKIVDNQYFNRLYGEDVDSWLREHVHIYSRHWCDADQSTADLACGAATKALGGSGINASDLDLIVVATDTPEYVSPATAAVVQHRIGAHKAGTFDLNAACAGFVTALDLAAKYIQADARYQYILVIGAYAMSKHLNLEDKKTATLFADGAGAVILSASKKTGSGWLASRLLTDGQYHDWMGIYAGGTKQPSDHTVLSGHQHQLQFVKKFPPSLNPDTWTRLILELAGDLSILPTEVHHFFITQINIYSIWETMDRLGIERKKSHTIMHDFGYTGSACIPMALHDAREKGLLKKGDLAFFIGSGGGLAFAAVAFRL